MPVNHAPNQVTIFNATTPRLNMKVSLVIYVLLEIKLNSKKEIL